MAESTLSLSYTDLMGDVSYFLYGQPTYTSLTAAQQAVCDKAVQNGYRQFLYPPALKEQGIPQGYEWSFMKPVTTLDTVADDADQDMPDDFGRLISDGFVFAADAQYPPVLGDVGEGKIRKLRASFDESGRPRVAGLRRKAIGDGTTGQRWEVMWYPKPDDAYTLSYRYEALVDKLDATAKYPLGGLKYADTLRASCIAAAAALVNDDRKGQTSQDFIERLVASIKRNMAEGPKFYGNVGPNEYDGAGLEVDTNYTLTVSGEQLYPE